MRQHSCLLSKCVLTSSCSGINTCLVPTSQFIISISWESQGVRRHERLETQRAARDVVESIKTRRGLGRARRRAKNTDTHTHQMIPCVCDWRPAATKGTAGDQLRVGVVAVDPSFCGSGQSAWQGMQNTESRLEPSAEEQGLSSHTVGLCVFLLFRQRWFVQLWHVSSKLPPSSEVCDSSFSAEVTEARPTCRRVTNATE